MANAVSAISLDQNTNTNALGPGCNRDQLHFLKKKIMNKKDRAIKGTQNKHSNKIPDILKGDIQDHTRQHLQHSIHSRNAMEHGNKDHWTAFAFT